MKPVSHSCDRLRVSFERRGPGGQRRLATGGHAVATPGPRAHCRTDPAHDRRGGRGARLLSLGAGQRVLGHRVIASSTLGTFLRAFSFGHLHQLEAIVGKVLGAGGRAPGRRRRLDHLCRGGREKTGRGLRLHQGARLPPHLGHQSPKKARGSSTALGQLRGQFGLAPVLGAGPQPRDLDGHDRVACGGPPRGAHCAQAAPVHAWPARQPFGPLTLRGPP